MTIERWFLTSFVGDCSNGNEAVEKLGDPGSTGSAVVVLRVSG
jgi:hypothetical protein